MKYLNQRHWFVNRIKAFNVWPEGVQFSCRRIGNLESTHQVKVLSPRTGWEVRLCIRVEAGPHFAMTMLIKGNLWLRARLIKHPEISGSENLGASLYLTNLMQDAKPTDLSFSKISRKGQGDLSAPALESVCLETLCDSMWPTFLLLLLNTLSFFPGFGTRFIQNNH